MPNADDASLELARTTRIFAGKLDEVGVAGSTLTEACGDRTGVLEADGDASDADDVLDALL